MKQPNVSVGEADVPWVALTPIRKIIQVNGTHLAGYLSFHLA